MTAVVNLETTIYANFSASRAPAPDSGETAKMTYKSPLELLQARLAREGIINARNKCARGGCDNAEQIHSEPELS